MQSVRQSTVIASRVFTTRLGEKLIVPEFGFGTSAVGNLYRPLSEQKARETLETAYASGITFYDTAPWYGLGLAESRLSSFLRQNKRSTILLSTKAGRVLHRAGRLEDRTGAEFWPDTPSRKVEFAYDYDGIMRSVEASLERLGVDHLDMLLVHDLDMSTHKDRHASYFKDFVESGHRAMVELRAQKVCRAIGAGINQWEPAEKLVNACDLDIVLLAGRYTLLEQEALKTFLPLCEQKNIGIVIGGPYNSGILVTGAIEGATHEYAKAPPAIMNRVRAITTICQKHRVALPVAALAFPLRHPAVLSIIPGGSSPVEVSVNLANYAARSSIPAQLWIDLKNEGLIVGNAPV